VLDPDRLEVVRVQPEQVQDRRRDLGRLDSAAGKAVMPDGIAGHDQRHVAVLEVGAAMLGYLLGAARVQGLPAHQDRRVVSIFERWSFTWGGRWLVPDGMHFELLTLRPTRPS
jgi:hypothetical protein